MLYIIIAYFGGLQIVAVSFVASFSFRFRCFIFDLNQLKVKFADKTGLRINSFA